MTADRLPCPDCAELVKRAALKCPHCGHQFSDLEQSLRTAGAGWRTFWDKVALVFWAVAISAGALAAVAYFS